MLSTLKLLWTWEGGKHRKYYLLHPWRVYYVYRAQKRRADMVRINVGPDSELYPQ